MTSAHGKLPASTELSRLIRKSAVPFTGEQGDFDALIELIDGASYVLIGEASHGTHEYYKTRIDLTKRLIEEKGFNVVLAEADWPDCWRVNQFVKGHGESVSASDSLFEFQRFPTWLWRNADILSFVEWLRSHNKRISNYDNRVGFYGLDLYSLYRSAAKVLEYLKDVDPNAAQRAYHRYACLVKFGRDEQAYGYAASLGLTADCEQKVLAELKELQENASLYMQRDGRLAADGYFFIEQNAKLVSHAQEYYKELFIGQVSTWNLRDRHMFETLIALKKHMSKHGQRMKAVIWAHNSHLGDARATEMSDRGELNLGQLMRERFPDDCILIGFTGYCGTVTAASRWGGVAERKTVRPALNASIEKLFHTVDLPAFILNLQNDDLTNRLRRPYLERAIGVIYSPETERQSHYFFTNLAEQFDAVIHFQETQAIEPLERTVRWIAGEDRVEDKID
ncbi:MAG TPA: erythromycin esterase family protein [Drouetiella sp.]|jgi:erythromycin esterase-like protein